MSALDQKRIYAVQNASPLCPPESDIKCDIWECPLRAISGHCRSAMFAPQTIGLEHDESLSSLVERQRQRMGAA